MNEINEIELAKCIKSSIGILSLFQANKSTINNIASTIYRYMPVLQKLSTETLRSAVLDSMRTCAFHLNLNKYSESLAFVLKKELEKAFEYEEFQQQFKNTQTFKDFEEKQKKS